jgi:beta-N-acetylhexosaminidase
MRTSPATAPLRSSGTVTLRQRAGAGTGHEPDAAVAAAGLVASAAAMSGIQARARSRDGVARIVAAVSKYLALFVALFSAQVQGALPAPEPAQAAPRERTTATATAPAPVRLTLAQLTGQHMVFAYDGLTPPPALRRRIARGEAAGVILFARNVRSAAQVRSVVRSLQAIARPRGLRAPLLVMADQEGGPVRRIAGAPERAAADVTSASQARADGRAAARTLRAAGVNMNLAPVADVARPGAALEAERRIYSRSPSEVASRASAFAAGLHAGGVRATAKHFPGFGAATVNTDDAPARIDTPLATLRSVDAAPFAALIAGGVDAVMISTAVYPALDERPAAFSSRWVGEELRDRLGFRGVTIADDLGTPAVRSFGSIGRRAVLAARAGVDLQLFVASYRSSARAAEGLLAAARRGDLSRTTLREQARRVLALRAKLPR